MATQPIAPEELKRRLAAFSEHGSIAAAARALGLPRTTMQSTLEFAAREGITTPSNRLDVATCPGVLELKLYDGIVIIFSDCHWWPGIVSTANRALLRFCKEFKPKVIIANGDLLDGATISRHMPIGWENRPSLIEELQTVKERLDEIVLAGDSALRYWTCGNHDGRFEGRIASLAPEYARVNGVHLKDHFDPDWQPCWSVVINDDCWISHKGDGGIHATHNNTVKAGISTMTGHLHSLKITPWTDFHGTRWGGDSGTLAPIYGPQFHYLSSKWRNWRSGFLLLTFRAGELLWPETVFVRNEADGEVEFRGQIIKV